MARRQKKQSGGIPEWVVTFGDMMSLLLCFFILLAAFSELKRDHEYQRVITAVKEAFGYSGGVGVLPTDDIPFQSMLELMEQLEMQQSKREATNRISESDVDGTSGKKTKVTRVRDGTMFTVGGALTFEPGSADLKPEAEGELLRIAQILKGRQNKIAIRGHTSSKVLPPSSPFRDLYDLSYYRAKAVADFLVEQGGINRTLLIVEARADTEPMETRKFSSQAQAVNRRVEIFMTEVTADAFDETGNNADPLSAQGTP